MSGKLRQRLEGKGLLGEDPPPSTPCEELGDLPGVTLLQGIQLGTSEAGPSDSTDGVSGQRPRTWGL